jgi:hypothetical protein
MVQLQFEDLKLQTEEGASWEAFFINKGDAALVNKQLTFELQITEL